MSGAQSTVAKTKTKAKTTRVFELAREIGVSSKDIIAKCAAEEIPGITNHMSAVSAGLAATIHEWFGDTAGISTAVETAAPVDVAKAKATASKKKAARKKAAKKIEPEPEGEVEALTLKARYAMDVAGMGDAEATRVLRAALARTLEEETDDAAATELRAEVLVQMLAGRGGGGGGR